MERIVLQERKILIMCVGDQDPLNKQGQLGPILSFMDYIDNVSDYQKYKPDRVYLISTANKPNTIQSTWKKGVDVYNRLRAKWEVYHRTLDVSDPTDYNQLIAEMKKVTESIIEENTEKNLKSSYFINVSPGTCQMQAVWMSFINSGIIKATLLQVIPPWHQPNETKRIRQVEEGPLFETDYIKIGTDLAHHYVFEKASDVFSELAIKTPDRFRAENAEFFSDLLSAYRLWENFDYRESLNKMEKILNGNIFKDPKFKDIENILKSQKEILKKLASRSLFEKVVDLYHKAVRRKNLYNYVEAILYCWSAYEIIIGEKAREAIRTECKLPNKFSIPFEFRKFINDNQGNPEVKKIINRFGTPNQLPKYLDRLSGEEFIKRTKHAISKIIEQNKENIKLLARKRHKAVHEASSPTLSECKEALGIIKGIINGIFNRPSDITDYPFSRSNLKFVIESISKSI